MPRYKEGRHTLNVLLTEEEYLNLKKYVAKNNQSMSNIAREYISQGLKGTLTEDNIDFLLPIIREQVKSVMTPMIERLAAMTAKTCVQSGTAAYLSAEALSSFVPIERQKAFIESYDAARKKAVQYLKRGTDYEKD